ncbi:MAG: SUMF1/EgtB/PvdO family nonheme iron enzyme, partial [Myxococcales bacterium]|nr:SUMF1/EgtB/PvdO family nonheme iron enzyme [Myxococcales bacterium]
HGRWDGIRPGDTAPTAIWLPPAGGLDDETVQVPAGWFIAGDPGAPDGLPERRVFVDAFAIGRDPVTNAQYIEWLDALVDDGREAEALAHAPRAFNAADRPLAYRRDAAGRFALDAADGMTWLPDGPVTSISWRSARAFCAWRAARDGLPWRLPHSVEWEKAARGVDGRRHGFGDHCDATFAMTARSRPGSPGVVAVGAFPLDVSPYGVRGQAGNVRDLCLDAYRRDGPRLDAGRLVPVDEAIADEGFCVVKGGAYSSAPEQTLAGARYGFPPHHAAPPLGFRLCHSLPIS